MISSSLFVLLLATYAYSVPVNVNNNIKNNIPELTSPQSAILHLLDDGDSTNVANLVEPAVQSGLQLPGQGSPLNNERVTRGMWEPSTPESTSESSSEPSSETSSQSQFRSRGIPETSTLFTSALETSSQFNDRKIRGENNVSDMDLQTTEEPTSSVTSFATTTGFLRNPRGQEPEELESSSMQMNDATTEFSSTGQSETVIEVFPGQNSKTEIIPGSNMKTEVISGPNTKTEIISNSGSKTEIITNNLSLLNGVKRPLSEGKN